MTSIFSTSSARGCFNRAAAVFGFALLVFQGSLLADGVNYSRWPKRPPLWTQATELLKQGKTDETMALLEKAAETAPLTPECRKLLDDLRFDRLLSPQGTDKETYVVKRGDSLTNIAKKTKSAADYIIAVNNIMEPGRLSIGDKLQVRALDMKIVIDVKARTISLADKGIQVKSYPILAMRSTNVGTVKTGIKSESGHFGAGAISPASEYYPSANKTIHLRNGMVIDGTRNSTAPEQGFYLSPENCNELSLLVIAGNEVEIIH